MMIKKAIISLYKDMYVPFSLSNYKLHFLSKGFNVKFFLIEDIFGEKYVIKFSIIKETDYRMEHRMRSRRVYHQLLTINHPNIVKVYEVEQIDSSNQDYVMIY